MEKDLFRNPASQYPKVRPRITAREIVASSDLEISFLDKSWPQQTRIVPIKHEESSCLFRCRQTIINDDLSPAAIKVETKDIFAITGSDWLLKGFVIRIEYR